MNNPANLEPNSEELSYHSKEDEKKRELEVSREEEEEEEDPWDERIKKTGCFEENENLLICHFDTGDWRKCTTEMKAFKDCMAKYSASKQQNYE